MKNGLIVEKSIGALRKAASDGHPFYCCERFEDDYGRLVVGVGARLEGRILQTVAKVGRNTVYVSKIAIRDGRQFQKAIEKVGKIHQNSRDCVQEMYGIFARMNPGAARKIIRLKPRAKELSHAREVGNYVRLLMATYNAFTKNDACKYSPKELMSGFVAGVVHDIGCWGGHPVCGHEKRGAQFLRDLVRDSHWIQQLADVVEGHHGDLSECSGEQFFRLAPVVLAEAVVERGKQTVYDLVEGGILEEIKDLLICVCNLEQCLPALSVVKIFDVGGLRHELAVSLRAEDCDTCGPYLLRFTQVDVRGRPRPVSLEARCLIGPGHPEYDGRELEVVDLLSEDVYKRLFEAYEGLVPVYQRIWRQETESTGARAASKFPKGTHALLITSAASHTGDRIQEDRSRDHNA